MPTTKQLRSRLIDKLKELFQLNQPDLDFGFYRIMHAKSEQVTRFLEDDLLAIIGDAFGEVDDTRKAQLKAEYEKEVETAKEYGAADPETVPKVKEARERYETAQDTATAEGEIYDHLYRFFERYYDNGDFISRRYYTRETPGKAAPFAVPYNGEEVKLHWANADQYYIKTAEHFRNFTVDLRQAKEIRELAEADELGLEIGDDNPRLVHFRIVDATEGEHGNVKASEASKRYFIIHRDEPVQLTDDGELVIQFEYRPDPEKSGQENTWRDKRNTEAVEVVLAALDSLSGADKYKRLITVPAPTDKDAKRPLLAKYVNQYTARNTMDYFIHKDLGAFLRRELDFYIKNEVMRLDDIESAEAPAVETYLSKLKVLRTIAHKLIDFLAQLEDFQKRLWLKKKFVVETNYCITLDRIPEEFYAEIAANAAQREEWVRLFSIDEIEASTVGPSYSEPLSVEFLKANAGLVLDTHFFSPTFTARLLGALDAIDEESTGLLIHADNAHALSMLKARLGHLVDVVYIDPPYNTGDGDFSYKDTYRHASWLTMMQERCQRLRTLLQHDGVFVCSLDDNEHNRFRMMVDSALVNLCIVGNAAWHKTSGSNESEFSHVFDNTLIYKASPEVSIGLVPRNEKQRQLYSNPDNDPRGPWASTDYTSKWSPRERPNLAYPIDNPHTGAQVHPKENAWRFSKKEHEKNVRDNKVWWGINGELKVPRYKRLLCETRDGVVPKSIWNDVGTNQQGKSELLALGFRESEFSNPKPIGLVKRAIHLGNREDVVLDAFAGSGTTALATIELNRADDGKRKYYLSEFGDYFDSVLKPRIQKAIYSTDWKDGKPIDPSTGVSHCFKYIRLESYEDCLNNLVFARDKTRDHTLERNGGLRNDYMLYYMLDVETRGSQSLLNIDAFADPTAYALRVKKPGSDQYVTRHVDLIETFNYLIGLRVTHIAAPQSFTASFKRETDPELPEDTQTRLVVDGRLTQDENGPWWFRKVEGWVPADPNNPNNGERQRVLIVWRKLTGQIEEDNLMLDEWFQRNRISTRDFEFDVIYVNGTNNLPNLKQEGDNWKVRLIEEDFMRLMWDVEDV